jgi:hypothetical protein
MRIFICTGTSAGICVSSNGVWVPEKREFYFIITILVPEL